MKPIRGLDWTVVRDSLLRLQPAFTCIAACGVLLGVTVGRSLAAAELRAGLAKTDITPTQPVKMAGYESRKDFSNGVHDPLSARALVFEQAGRHLALVSIDNLGFYNDTAAPLRKAILDQCHLEPSELLLCAIHTHSAPTLTLDAATVSDANVEYTRSLESRLADLVSRAIQGTQPIQISLGRGSSPVGVNRREIVTDGTSRKIVLGRNPDELTDREVQVMKLTRPGQDRAVGALFDYATHSTSLGPRNYLISGDVHGLAAQFLENYYGQGFIAPEFAGASGNIDPWVRVLPDFRTNNGWIPEPVLLGTMLGEEVARVLETSQRPVTNTVLASMFRTVELPGKPDTNGVSAAGRTVPFNITLGRVGEIAFVGWGGEVFNEVGKRVKSSSPFSCTIVMTHCNGAAGYVPIRSSYAEGGYEVQSSPFGPGADEVLADATLEMLRCLHGERE
ncbi:MAG TPA: neutral/alkaline non-lysosomal ceramidase N-terminal domain-containing protein [Verrucomicrobiae bacterium]|nr:neutral/alkaline non-lysosomal ceramidase N-terminal domain-containing protein [Verrucomicrobiae bacterium]